MKKNNIKYFLFIALLITGAISCKKPLDTPAATIVGTPYEIPTPEGFPPVYIPLDNPTTVEGIALGKMLFFDPILSGDNTQACASCHRQNFGFTDSTNALSTGIDKVVGTRNSMPIFNLGWDTRFFWDGGAEGLESQALGPILNPVEMHEDLSRAVDELSKHPKYPEMFIIFFHF